MSLFQYFSNRINGLECEIHDWMTVSLIQTMQYCGFKLKNMCHSQTDRECQSLIFYVPKAFITTPLSYLLERSVPQGRLKRLHIYLDWETKNLQPLRSLMEYPNEELIQYVDNGFSIILCQRMSQMYPLIFSKLYVQRLATSTKYIPTMARSLQRIADIAKTKSATDFYADTREMIDAIASRTRMLKPEEDPANPDFFSNTVIGLYCATKNMSTLRQCAKVEQKKKPQTHPPEMVCAQSMIQRPKPPALHTSTPSSPPDAHDTVANLWSAFRCDVEPIPELSNSQADASEDEELNIDDPFIHDL
ncbi:uncharacterized protein BYT42DRAFT_573497 [Radiomyces spectabilis]|uniref:uncharacterized protein n=1 Tax=Radiomyces spectabilis TaxID=64574 RepID=UPI0022201F5D|nr:uncharacterized protein BYT42DRAFT_573497 [Radiomyces spectabilis]KAI8376124.1 hypothetical protein BYT42DRAFT_573497 [Radiomyces spectabilis]